MHANKVLAFNTLDASFTYNARTMFALISHIPPYFPLRHSPISSTNNLIFIFYLYFYISYLSLHYLLSISFEFLLKYLYTV